MAEKELVRPVPLTIATKFKYLRINSNKDLKEL